MIGFFLLSLPVFGVIGAGWAATRAHLLASGALDALNVFSFRFALPALVLRLIAGQPLRQSFNPSFYAGYLASGVIVFMLVLGASRLAAACTVAAAGAHATTATVSNLGFLGPPLMLAFFGERGAGALAMAILAEIMVLLSIGGVLMGANGDARRGIGSQILRGTAFNPVVAAIVLGAMLAGTGLALPEPVARFLMFLGGAAGPTALFALGGALALQRLDRGTVVAACLISLVKLVVYPLLTWFVLRHLMKLDPFWVQAGTLIACLPSAGNIYVLAQRYDADPQRVSATILLSTITSVVTFPCAAWLVLR
ncbi:Membrane transport protein (plasmid) [Caballeronia sp. SBC1]|uniref:AEC family transporter n=1 Tax=unclassified Caballeronia TaxID=2646786 RepID=UPI0013E1C7C3|nr:MULTISPECIES: AEC family transporter [unclassified Caballeronia]QIE26474.1 Membrane transport protein [Caballeronia sp. SBC2]QIN64209.1 Membrane transport protein [Caballeronia sp. SBC1]